MSKWSHRVQTLRADQTLFSQLTGLPPRRIIHFCERDIIRPIVDPGGRGRPRYFSALNVLEARLATIFTHMGYRIRTLQTFGQLIRAAWRTEKYFKDPVWFVCVDGNAAVFKNRRDNWGWVKLLPVGAVSLKSAPIPEVFRLDVVVPTAITLEKLHG